MNIPTVPCETCNDPTTYTGTKRCNRCWEVERNLADYAKTPNGRQNLIRAVGIFDVNALKRWLGKERARYERIQNSAAGSSSRERAFGEATVCTLVITKINEMMKKPRTVKS